MKLRLMPTAVLLLGPYPVYAANNVAPLDTVIVTATRTAQTVDESLAAVTVITRQDIERQQAQSVQDVLRGTPGLSIANNGGAGKQTSFFLRGTESDHVLVLIDGIKVGSATTGMAAFQDYPIDQIERIEIVRGPRSSLYGSEAIGGVIQIFTRKGGGALTPSFSVGGGSYNTYKASAGVSGGGENSWFNASVSGMNSSGFNACNGKPFPGGAGCFTVEPDKDGYRNKSGTLRGGYRFGKLGEVDLHWLGTEGRVHYDGSFQNESKSTQQVYGGRLLLNPVDALRLSLAAGRSQDDSDNFKDGIFSSRFNSERDTVSLQGDISVAAQHLLTAGFDYQNDRVDSTAIYSVASRDNKGLFTQYQGAFGAHDVQASVRHDKNQQFGEKTTGGLAWGYAINNLVRVTANYGTAFKAPTFNELYYPGYGNPNLRSEQSRSIELGLRGAPAWGSWSAHVFRTAVNDLIGFDPTTFAPVNIDSARLRGVEGAVATQLAGWHMNTSLTLLDPENRASGTYNGNVLPRRAEQTLRVNMDRGFGHYRVGATLFAEGKRFDDLANTRTMGGYTTLDLRVERALAKNWLVQARIANLFDKRYETASYYNQAGRNFFITFRYQPGKSPT
ncbi:MAG: TonB-dependent vitamin B12 receptor [Gammaproteobacteria bacterium]